jgi:hypothetical protein
MYGKPSDAHVPLDDGKWGKITISRGVRQGDSLGPAYFILGILEPLQECRKAHPSVTIRSFYDDINITGPPNSVLEAYRHLRRLLTNVGLKFNPAKSKVLAPQGLSPNSAAAFALEGLPVPKTSMELLGTIIGSANEILAFLDRKERDYLDGLELIQLGITKGFQRQVAFKLLRYCAATRHLHLLRTIPPNHTKSFAARIDEHSAKMIFSLCRGFFVNDQPVDRPADPTCDKLIFLPLKLGGLAIPHLSVLAQSEYVSALRKSARIVYPGVVDYAALKTQFFDFFPQMEQACSELAELADSSKAIIDQDVAEGAANLGSELAMKVHEATAEVLVQGMPMRAAIGHRSSRLPEAGTPFMYPHDHPSRLDDKEFILALFVRILFPAHRRRDTCALCDKPADETLLHDLSCTSPKENRTTSRHSLVQRKFVDSFKNSSHINKAKFSLDSAQPNYSNFGDRILPPGANATAPSNSRFRHPDIKIMRRTENALTNGENILVDFTVAGLNAQSAQRASETSGVLAAVAEERKISEVRRYWKLHPEVRILPYAVEFTGGHGLISRNFLHELFDIPPPPKQGDESDAQRIRDMRDDKMQALHRFKAAITAAVWVGNYNMYQAYTNSLRAEEIAGNTSAASEDEE